ncbi:MAG: Fic family protein [Methylobacteriaceae bacterium]|jgi:Fic family protein|nr:Fic family protein [Methylobacteriaceae bacterium]
MTWNWQRADWPDFTWDRDAVEPLEHGFFTAAGEFAGVFRHLDEGRRRDLRIELLTDEALKTSEIEGELLDRSSVQSSLLHAFGLRPAVSAPDRERGIAQLTAEAYNSFAEPLSSEMLFHWHRLMMRGNTRIGAVGAYRTFSGAMQVVSGVGHGVRVHFEAPPSRRVPSEMERFVFRFNDSAPGGGHPLPPLTRAALIHLYFESIHPFEDGNGRIGRALAEKSLAQSLGRPTLFALALAVERDRRAYYKMLEQSNKSNEMTAWIVWFGQTILAAGRLSLERVEFSITRAKYHDAFAGRMNPRQEKAVARLFREGPGGFKGGLSAENYMSITGAPRSTAGRDLRALVDIGALTRTGELRYTRYHLNLAPFS